MSCCDGVVRLAGGSLSNEGRVEVCQSGEWKTVCVNSWRENEARVVCRQLGYGTQGMASNSLHILATITIQRIMTVYLVHKHVFSTAITD